MTYQGYISHSPEKIPDLLVIRVKSRSDRSLIFSYESPAIPSQGDLIDLDGHEYYVHTVVSYPRQPDNFCVLVDG